MAQTGYTPISLYYTTTAAAAPTAGNLVNGELAINITDGKLYYKDNAGVVKLLASNAASATTFSAGTTGFTPSTATSGAVTLAGTLVAANGGTGQTSYAVGDILYASTTTALSKLADIATGNALISGGVSVAPSWGKIGLTTHVSGTLPIANGGTGATTLAGANIAVTNVANTFTALQTFTGSTSVADMKTSNIKETVTVSATAATGTIAYDITTQSVLYYTTNASANWTVNFRGSSGTTLNTLMATGESMSVTFLVTQGATAYYNSAVQVDGASVTPKWQGGSAPTSGNASSIDSYTYVIIKTGSAAFTVLASQTKFA